MKNNNLDAYLEEFAKTATLNKFDPFMQKIITEDNINYRTVAGLKELAAVRELAIVINYYGGSQFIIMKRNLEKKYNRELSDDEVINIVNKMRLPFLFRNSLYDINLLSAYDRADIYQNIRMLRTLKEKNAFNTNDFENFDEALECLEDFDFHFLAIKYACIANVKQKIEFDSFGMQDYLDKIIPKIMNKEKTKVR